MAAPVSSTRYALHEWYVPRVGPHRGDVVEVIRITPGDDYDLVRVRCRECATIWQFLHHHQRFAKP